MNKRHASAPEHIKRYRDLLDRLDKKGSTSQLNLHSRLKKCEGPDWGHRFTCRSPACPRCRDRYIARQRRDAQERFDGATNLDLRMVSIVLGATYDIWEVGRILNKARSDLRNRINKLRRGSSAWNDFEIVGWLEVDAYDPDDVHLLGSDKIIQLKELLSYSDSTLNMIGPVWSPTIHAIVRVPPSLDQEDVRSAFEDQWPHHRQVDVRSFHFDKTAHRNIGNIVNYANKHECLTGPSGFRSAWDTSWQVRYYDWLHQFSRGFLSIRLSVKPRRANVSGMTSRTVSFGRGVDIPSSNGNLVGFDETESICIDGQLEEPKIRTDRFQHCLEFSIVNENIDILHDSTQVTVVDSDAEVSRSIDRGRAPAGPTSVRLVKPSIHDVLASIRKALENLP